MAKAALAEAKAGVGESQRVRLAREQAATAQAAVDQEAAKIGCRKECERKQGVAREKAAALTDAFKDDAADRQAAVGKAETEVAAALVEAVAVREAKIKAAQGDVAANPAPASATPLADRTGVPAWLIDLGLAALLSLAANGLGASLVAIGARGAKPSAERDHQSVNTQSPQCEGIVVRGHFGRDGPNKSVGRRTSEKSRQSIRRRPDRPKAATPSGGLMKSEALDDLMQRLSDGPIYSQDELARAWNRPKQTVSNWMREWRRTGVVPAATPAGRCKATIPA